MKLEKMEKELFEKGYFKIGTMEDEIKLITNWSQYVKEFDIKEELSEFDKKIKKIINKTQIIYWSKWEKDFAETYEGEFEAVRALMLQLHKKKEKILITVSDIGFWWNNILYNYDRNNNIYEEECELKSLLR